MPIPLSRAGNTLCTTTLREGRVKPSPRPPIPSER
ncbi:Uncharacterised protein [Vibrio cholerae]|nr:Uncharacterised protein [Vibrio cholerae]